MSSKYDVLIVGARIAGSATALQLARKGYRVLMVDRASFPSDIMSGHYFHQPGVARMKHLGLLDELIALGAPPMTRVVFDVGPFALAGSPPPVDGIAEGYGPRRYLLDKMLVDAAVDAGAELRENFAVRELVWEDGRVVGLRGSVHGGEFIEERAPITIGADGVHSFVARTVHAPEYHVRPTLTCNYYSYFSGIPTNGTELYPRPNRFMINQPTNDGLSYIGVMWPLSEFRQVRSNIEASFFQALEAFTPELAERVHAGQREERFIGTGDIPNYLRKPYGPGWALAGDAGYHRDPLTAQGMTDALRDAELLSQAIDEGFRGERPLVEALAAYERRRNEAVMPMYEMTCQLAALQLPPPEMQALFGALRGNQAEINNFLGTVSGAVSIPQFFAPENMERIIHEGTAMMDLQQ